MALEKATHYKSFSVPKAYYKINDVSSTDSGTNRNGDKTYIVIIMVGIYKDESKTQLLGTDRHVFTMIESDITRANIYEKLKLKYTDSTDI